MTTARRHSAAERNDVPAPIAEVTAVELTDTAANDETVAPPPVRTFSIDGDPLFGMAIASVILFAIFAGLMASF